MSEPVHIKEILPDVMDDIRERMEHQKQKHYNLNVINAVRDYIGTKQHKSNRLKGKIKKEKLLF